MRGATLVEEVRSSFLSFVSSFLLTSPAYSLTTTFHGSLTPHRHSSHVHPSLSLSAVPSPFLFVPCSSPFSYPLCAPVHPIVCRFSPLSSLSLSRSLFVSCMPSTLHPTSFVVGRKSEEREGEPNSDVAPSMPPSLLLATKTKSERRADGDFGKLLASHLSTSEISEGRRRGGENLFAVVRLALFLPPSLVLLTASVDETTMDTALHLLQNATTLLVEASKRNTHPSLYDLGVMTIGELNWMERWWVEWYCWWGNPVLATGVMSFVRLFPARASLSSRLFLLLNEWRAKRD
jgi:hypothetical protein